MYEPAPPDTQEHIFWCKKVKVLTNNIASNKIEYNDIFKDVYKQKEVTTYFTSLLESREKAIQENENPPGDKLDQSSCNCCNSTIFTHCSTDGIIIGNK